MNPAKVQADMKTARSLQPGIQLTLSYKPDGAFDIGGINPLFLGMLPVPWDSLKLPPDTLQSISDLGLESVSLTTAQGGLLLAINGNTLPYLQWANAEELTNMFTLVGNMVGGENSAMIAGVLQGVQPILNFPGLSVGVSFPAPQ
jgi:hypothetical protein